MGVKKTGDLLEKLTWGFAIALLVLSVATNFVLPEQSEGLSSPNIDNAQNQVVPPPAFTPPAQDGAQEGLDLETEVPTDTSGN